MLRLVKFNVSRLGLNEVNPIFHWFWSHWFTPFGLCDQVVQNPNHSLYRNFKWIRFVKLLDSAPKWWSH
jgi:hypothetical protein